MITNKQNTKKHINLSKIKRIKWMVLILWNIEYMFYIIIYINIYYTNVKW
jgi:hypothetical protein